MPVQGVNLGQHITLEQWFQSVVLRSVTSSSPAVWFEMWILGLLPRPAGSEIVGWAQGSLCTLRSSLGDSDAC